MKKIILTLCSVAILLFACNNEKKTDDAKKETTSSETKKDESTKSTDPKPELDSATMMKNWQDYMTPGDVHKMMAKGDGTWNGDVSMWMVPGALNKKVFLLP